MKADRGFQENFEVPLLAWLPNFPNIAGEIRANLERWFSGLPPCRADFRAFCLAHVLKGLELADRFSDSPAHWRRQDFKRLDDAVRIDDEPATDIHTARFVVDTVHRSDFSSGVGEHREGEAAIDHLRQFLFLPDFVHETAVRAAGKNLYVEFAEFFGFVGDRRQFGGSDEGEISGVKAEEHPLAPEV